MIKPSFGKMNIRITLQTAQNIIASGGGREQKYSDIATVWASAEIVPRKTASIAGKPEFGTGIIFTTHYRKSFLKARRVLMHGRIFNVTGLQDPNVGRRTLIFQANEVL